MDTDNEVNVLLEYCKSIGVKVNKCTHWADGGKGTEEDKFDALEKAGVRTVRSPAKMGETLAKLMS